VFFNVVLLHCTPVLVFIEVCLKCVDVHLTESVRWLMQEQTWLRYSWSCFDGESM